MRRFYFADLPSAEQSEVLLDPKTSHHLLRVLGVAPEEEFELFDGRKSCLVRLKGVNEGRAICQWTKSLDAGDLSKEVWLLMGLIRQQPFSNVLRMATEIGVSRIIPVLCERSVARADKYDRWLRIIQSSAAQCGRVRLPKLDHLCSPSEAIQRSAELPVRVLLNPGEPSVLQATAPMGIWIGPEGGLSSDEVLLAKEHGWSLAGLGDTVLRADTAAAVSMGLCLLG